MVDLIRADSCVMFVNGLCQLGLGLVISYNIFIYVLIVNSAVPSDTQQPDASVERGRRVHERARRRHDRPARRRECAAAGAAATGHRHQH